MDGVVYPKNAESYEKDGKVYYPGTGLMLADTFRPGMKLSKKAMADVSATGQAPPVGWLASEKMDGLRVLWNGRDMVTRASVGKDPKAFVSVPAWFLDALPLAFALDGELWMGRGAFGAVAGISNTLVASHAQWARVAYTVFDAPAVEGGLETRLARAAAEIDRAKKTWLKLYPKKKYPVEIIRSEVVRNEEHLTSMFSDVTSKGGEGIVIRAPGSPYVPRRSKYMLKVKTKCDTEGVVQEHVQGEGKYRGMLGALHCRELGGKGQTFRVGTGFSDAQRKDYERLYPVGTVISVSFMEYTPDGNLRMPVFRGVREDA